MFQYTGVSDARLYVAGDVRSLHAASSSGLNALHYAEPHACSVCARMASASHPNTPASAAFDAMGIRRDAPAKFTAHDRGAGDRARDRADHLPELHKVLRGRYKLGARTSPP
jgi:hypothetical protein